MASNGGPNGSAEESLHTELESILREPRNRGVVDRDRDRERDLNIYRSGSAPPTVEGSLSAVGGLFGANDFRAFGVGANEDDEFRSHPDYLSFYYSHDNVNPRLPPPLLSREDWRVARRFSGAGGGGSSSSLFSMQPDPVNARRTHAPQADWPFERGSDGFGTSPGGGGGGGGLGVRRKSFADILQEGADRPASSNFLSRPSSRNNFNEDVELLGALRNGVSPLDLSGIQSQGAAVSYPLSSVPGLSLSRNTTPEPKLVGRSPGSGLPPVGSRVEQKNFRAFNPQSGYTSEMNELADITANLSGLSVSKFRDRDMNSHGQSKLSLDGNSEFLFKSGYGESLQREFIDNSETDNLSAAFNYNDLARMNGTVNNMSASMRSSNMHASFPRRTSSSANLYSQVGSSGFGSLDGQNAYHQNATTDFISGSFPSNHNHNSAIDSHLDTVLNSIQNGHMNNLGNKAGPDLHSPLSDPRYVQFLQRNPDYATRAANSLTDLSLVKNQFSTSHGELEGFQKAYIERLLLAQQREQLELSLLGKSSGYNSIGSYGPSSPYQGNTIGNSVLPNVGSGSPLFQSERVSRYSSMMRNSMPMGRSTGSINSEINNSPEGKITSSILDEFKNNKIKSFELPDIVGHVVEFSMDQYGSRFIQQKLETATAEEKAIIFPEIIPLAHGLMTDVFGNYVIQKFFEHGTESQRKELANQLTGHVLPLSLQMYGCRVIQKALEVVGLDQQTQMVAELDGSIMKCVRDQNGNHVIQKCIECVPQECIQFIITAFYGQVVVLSTHPYGCRVIQRVLEHCDDSNTQQIIMNEIMQSVCTLAQDQYGNYVIQHVLQHGNPQERSTIIYKLAGQIVRMSQQKFASNVVEKCLTFGTPDERQILVNEMLGSTDENEPLQAMMKDPFGNYVVQKVLETCNDESLELLLSRIKVHLNTLKRFTYGKHIVSRIEKLVATGERRIGLSSTISS